MAIAHTAPGELVNIRGPAGTIRPEDSEMLIRTDHLEVFRYALRGGKVVATHTAAGLMVVQCLEGTVESMALDRARQLTPGTMLYPRRRTRHPSRRAQRPGPGSARVARARPC